MLDTMIFFDGYYKMATDDEKAYLKANAPNVSSTSTELKTYEDTFLKKVENTDLLTLDRYEGVKSGVYRRIKVNPSVFGINIEAFAYQVNNPGEDKAPSLEYLSHLIRGAESFSLPSFYQSELQSAITGKSENF